MCTKFSTLRSKKQLSDVTQNDVRGLGSRGHSVPRAPEEK